MFEAIPAFVVGCVAQPIVGAEVDDASAFVDETRDDRCGRTVWQRQEDSVDVRQSRVDDVVGSSEVGMWIRHWISVAIAALEAGDTDLRMTFQDADELAADEAGSTDDADTDGCARRG